MNPYITVDQIKNFVYELAGMQPEAEQIRTRNDRYASFLVQVDKSVEERVLDQDEWKEGLIVRPFRGFLRRNTHDPAVIITTGGSTGVWYGRCRPTCYASHTG